MASSNANKLGLSLINPLFLANRFKYKGIYSPFLALYKSSSVIAFKEYFLKKRILVTGVGGRSIGSGILHALLRSDPSVCERWEVVSSDAIPFAWGLYTTPERLLLPYAQSSDYIPALEKAVDHFRIDAIVPGTQVEIEILSQHREKFGVPILGNRPDLVPLMMDKTLLAPTLKSLGLPFIETLPLECWSTIAHKFGFPLVVKPTINTSGSRGLHLVLDETEMKNILPLIDRSTQPCVQPYIGTDQDEYTVGVLSDINGNLIDSIVIRRELVGMSLHTARTLNGKNYSISSGHSQGHVIRHKKIQDYCENLAQAMGSVGPLNLQLRIHNDQIYLFEFHPRFSGTTPFRADVGFNEVDILLRNVLYGENFGRLNYQTDVTVIRAFEHLIVPTSQLHTFQ